MLQPEEIRVTKKSHPALFVYLSGLGTIILFIQSVIIFGLLFVLYLTSFTDYLLWPGVPTVYILLLLTAAQGAYTRKKWGLNFNLFCLIFFIPFLVIFPMVMLWIVPHSGVVFPAITFVFGVLIAGFDIFYIYWFIKNRKLFT